MNAEIQVNFRYVISLHSNLFCSHFINEIQWLCFEAATGNSVNLFDNNGKSKTFSGDQFEILWGVDRAHTSNSSACFSTQLLPSFHEENFSLSLQHDIRMIFDILL